MTIKEFVNILSRYPDGNEIDFDISMKGNFEMHIIYPGRTEIITLTEDDWLKKEAVCL